MGMFDALIQYSLQQDAQRRADARLEKQLAAQGARVSERETSLTERSGLEVDKARIKAEGAAAAARAKGATSINKALIDKGMPAIGLQFQYLDETGDAPAMAPELSQTLSKLEKKRLGAVQERINLESQKNTLLNQMRTFKPGGASRLKLEDQRLKADEFASQKASEAAGVRRKLEQTNMALDALGRRGQALRGIRRDDDVEIGRTPEERKAIDARYQERRAALDEKIADAPTEEAVVAAEAERDKLDMKHDARMKNLGKIGGKKKVKPTKRALVKSRDYVLEELDSIIQNVSASGGDDVASKVNELRKKRRQIASDFDKLINGVPKAQKQVGIGRFRGRKVRVRNEQDILTDLQGAVSDLRDRQQGVVQELLTGIEDARSEYHGVEDEVKRSFQESEVALADLLRQERENKARIGDLTAREQELRAPYEARKKQFLKRRARLIGDDPEEMGGLIGQVKTIMEEQREAEREGDTKKAADAKLKAMASVAKSLGMGDYEARMATGNFDFTDGSPDVRKFASDARKAAARKSKSRAFRDRAWAAIANATLMGKQGQQEDKDLQRVLAPYRTRLKQIEMRIKNADKREAPFIQEEEYDPLAEEIASIQENFYSFGTLPRASKTPLIPKGDGKKGGKKKGKKRSTSGKTKVPGE